VELSFEKYEIKDSVISKGIHVIRYFVYSLNSYLLSESLSVKPVAGVSFSSSLDSGVCLYW